MDSLIDLGYPLEKLPFKAWVDAIENHGNSTENPLQPLLPFFHLEIAARMFGVSDAAYHALGTNATQQALEGSGIQCAPINRDLLRTYLERFADTGRLYPRPVLAFA